MKAYSLVSTTLKTDTVSYHFIFQNLLIDSYLVTVMAADEIAYIIGRDMVAVFQLSNSQPIRID